MKNLNLRIKGSPEDRGQKALNVNLVGGMPGGGGAGDIVPSPLPTIDFEEGTSIAHVSGFPDEIKQGEAYACLIENCLGHVHRIDGGGFGDIVTVYYCDTEISAQGYPITPPSQAKLHTFGCWADFDQFANGEVVFNDIFKLVYELGESSDIVT